MIKRGRRRRKYGATNLKVNVMTMRMMRIDAFESRNGVKETRNFSFLKEMNGGMNNFSRYDRIYS